MQKSDIPGIFSRSGWNPSFGALALFTTSIAMGVTMNAAQATPLVAEPQARPRVSPMTPARRSVSENLKFPCATQARAFIRNGMRSPVRAAFSPALYSHWGSSGMAPHFLAMSRSTSGISRRSPMVSSMMGGRRVHTVSGKFIWKALNS